MEMREIYSCYCQFDVCCLAKLENESFQELGLRVNNQISDEYSQLLKKGMCKCSLCKPIKFRRRSNWLLRAELPKTDYEKLYIVCREHIEKCINETVLSITQKMRANQVCRNKNVLQNRYQGDFPSCFFFYQEDIITTCDFSISCKILFASLPEFRLKKVNAAIENGNDF